MIPSVEWLVAADSLILWFMSSAARWRLVASPSTVAINIGMSSSHTNRRMSKLEDAGLLEVVDERGYYRISDKGEAFILGQLDADDLEDPDED